MTADPGDAPHATRGGSVDAVLLIAFGGPESLKDVRPFLANVVRGRPVPPERLEEVAHHYERIGGRSPLNERTFEQAAALRAHLAAQGAALPVYVGMRNWRPYLRDTLQAMHRDGIGQALGIILAAQQSDASWDRYVRDVAAAHAALRGASPATELAPPWPTHPLFIEAVADRVAGALASLPAERREAARLVFTAHSIPVAMAAAARYEAQLCAGAAAVAARLDVSRYDIAYQSRSGNPREPWLEPDIADALRAAAAAGVRDVVAVPLGFLCDHVEVLYDLDIEAAAVAQGLGLGFVRAPTVNAHPSFIALLAELVAAHRQR